MVPQRRREKISVSSMVFFFNRWMFFCRVCVICGFCVTFSRNKRDAEQLFRKAQRKPMRRATASTKRPISITAWSCVRPSCEKISRRMEAA